MAHFYCMFHVLSFELLNLFSNQSFPLKGRQGRLCIESPIQEGKSIQTNV